MLDVGIEGLDDSLVDLRALTLALDEDHRGRVWPASRGSQSDVHAVIVPSWSEFDRESSLTKKLGGETLELPPVNGVHTLEVHRQEVGEALGEVHAVGACEAL